MESCSGKSNLYLLNLLKIQLVVFTVFMLLLRAMLRDAMHIISIYTQVFLNGKDGRPIGATVEDEAKLCADYQLNPYHLLTIL